MEKPPTLLILEDEPLIAIDHANSAEKMGWHVRMTALPDLALQEIRTQRIDAALLDIQIKIGPGFTSYDVADTLVQRGVPFVFITGLPREFIEERFRDRIPILGKPTLPSERRNILRLLLTQISQPPHSG